jgi:exopolysaccharide biosynthesis polyprenyl glycosylphosphotransferase
MLRMSGADAVADELGVQAQPPAAVAPPPRAVRSRHRDRDYALRRALLVADMAGLCLALGLAMTVSGRASTLGDVLWILPALPLWALLFWSYRLYGRAIRRCEPTHVDDLPTLFHALVIGTLGMWLYYKLVAPVAQLNLEEVVVFALAALPLIATLRAALRAYNLRLQGPERVFALAPQEDVSLLRRKLANHPEYEMEVAGALVREPARSWDEQVDEIEELVASGEIDHLMVRLDSRYLRQERLQALMRACHRAGVRFSCFPAARGLLPPGVELNHLEGLGLLSSAPPVLPRTAAIIKRCMDIVVSALSLVVLAPLLAAIGVAIVLDSQGPVLYRQTRVGRHGERFELLKFRTMEVGADRLDDKLMEDSVDPHWLVMEEDPRVTRVGRFLRRNSLDELPQLWNVLRGEMGMVGPRPLSERDDRKVRGWRRNRLDLTPGITGYWQVLGRNSIPFEEMLEADYAYVTGWSLLRDIKLLLETVPAVLRRRGAN